MNYIINYKLLAENGNIIDEAKNFKFTLGDQTFAKELEDCIKEAKIGKLQTFLLNGADVFGNYNDNAKTSMDITELPENIKVGSIIDFDLINGSQTMATILEIDNKNNKALVDFNHPLSKINIAFKIKVIARK